jgi:hypothetical protein
MQTNIARKALAGHPPRDSNQSNTAFSGQYQSNNDPDWTLTPSEPGPLLGGDDVRRRHMLDIDCESCGRTLIGPRRILSVTPGDGGLRVAYVCWCGRHGDEVVARRRPARRPEAASPALAPAGAR